MVNASLLRRSALEPRHADRFRPACNERGENAEGTREPGFLANAEIMMRQTNPARARAPTATGSPLERRKRCSVDTGLGRVPRKPRPE